MHLLMHLRPTPQVCSHRLMHGPPELLRQAPPTQLLWRSM
jgi:hypothetical protein